MEKTRLTRIPVLLKTTIGGRQNSVLLQKLKPDTPYDITVSSLYSDGEGGRMTGTGKTSKWIQAPVASLIIAMEWNPIFIWKRWGATVLLISENALK